MAEGARKGRKRLSNLREQVDEQSAMLWPTPTGREYKGGRKPETLAKKGRKPSNTLCDAVLSIFPTPTTGAGLCGGSGNYQQLKRLQESGIINEEERRNMSQGNGGQLNPDWVDWLMGFPVGWTDIDKDVKIPSPPEGWWPDEPEGVPRVKQNVPYRVSRLKADGNAVVPQQFYPVARAIADIERGVIT